MDQMQSSALDQLNVINPRAARAAQSLAADLRDPDSDLIETRRKLPVRADLVAKIKARIADGSYLSEAKMDTAVERLMLDLEFESRLSEV